VPVFEIKISQLAREFRAVGDQTGRTGQGLGSVEIREKAGSCPNGRLPGAKRQCNDQ
jgi:hypothetical protein